jgi:hypothetical protein
MVVFITLLLVTSHRHRRVVKLQQIRDSPISPLILVVVWALMLVGTCLVPSACHHGDSCGELQHPCLPSVRRRGDGYGEAAQTHRLSPKPLDLCA